MNREHITSQQLWFLITLWETRSIALTAQKLEISTATATRLMTAVRTLLRDPLFLRGYEGLIPTARMTALYPKLVSAQTSLINIARPDKFSPADISATIRIAGVDNAAFAFLLPCISELYRQAPNLRISLIPLTDDFTTLLEEGKIDIVFYAPPLKLRPDFYETPLYSAGHVLVTRQDHPLAALQKAREAKGESLTAEDLLAYKEIELTYGTLEGVRHTVGKDGTSGTQPVAMDCAYFLASVFFLLETDFFTRLPVFTADYLSRYLPIAVLPKKVRAEMPTWCARMIWHERTDRDPALQWFRSILTDRLKAKPEAA